MKKEIICTLVKTGILRKREIDKFKIKSTLESAKDTALVAKSIKITDKSATLVFREIYESIRQIGDAKWWSIGYEPQNHDISLSILKSMEIKNKVKLNFLDRYKQIRHNANYQGEKVSETQAKEIIDFWNLCGEDLMKTILEELK